MVARVCPAAGGSYELGGCARVHNGLPACGLTYRAARQRAQQSKLLLGQRKSKGAHTGAEMAKDWRCTPSYLIIVRA